MKITMDHEIQATLTDKGKDVWSSTKNQYIDKDQRKIQCKLWYFMFVFGRYIEGGMIYENSIVILNRSEK